ncbi:MAG: hypothetical protein ACXWJS_09340, partial [Hyphomicrobium sp.]
MTSCTKFDLRAFSKKRRPVLQFSFARSGGGGMSPRRSSPQQWRGSLPRDQFANAVEAGPASPFGMGFLFQFGEALLGGTELGED